MNTKYLEKIIKGQTRNLYYERELIPLHTQISYFIKL